MGASKRRRGLPPAAAFCPACHGQYFPASLPFHLKTCYQKHPFVELTCSKCKGSVRAGVLFTHEATCDGAPTAKRTMLPLTMRGHGSSSSSSTAPSPVLELNPPDPDGRIRCKKCYRGFNPDRIAKHQAVCHATPKPDPLEAAKNNQLAVYTPAFQMHSQKRSTLSVQRKERPKRKQPGATGSFVKSAGVLLSALPTTQFSGNQLGLRDAGDVWQRKAPPRFRAAPLTMQPGRSERPGVRFDVVMRDRASAFGGSSGSGSGNGGGRTLNLLTTNASSASNPLVTHRFQTMMTAPMDWRDSD